jgi:hypothetical protein
MLLSGQTTYRFLDVACSSRALQLRWSHLSAFRKEGQYPSISSDDSHVSIWVERLKLSADQERRDEQ